MPAADSGGVAAPSAGLETALNTLPSGGRPLPDPVRAFFEPRLGYDLSPVRVHTGAQTGHVARSLNAIAFTAGQDIYFAPGRYQPHTPDGRRLLAHELTHTIQQSEGRGAPSRGPPSVQRYSLDEFLDDAADVGESIVSGAETAVDVAGEALTTAGEALVTAGETALAAGEAALDWLASTAGQAALSAAYRLVAVLGGTVTLTASGIIIRIPAVAVCDLHALTLPGPALDHTIPLYSGTLPITSNVLLHGSLSANFALQSGLNLSFGPCLLGPTTITIDPLRNHYSASSQFSVPAGFNLMANASQMLQGQASLTILIPVGSAMVLLTVPVIGLSAGLLETLLVVGAGMLTIPATLSYSAGVISFVTTPRLDLVGLVDFLLAAGGSLSLLGFEICSLVWPFFRWTRAGAATLALGLSISYNTGSGALIGANSASFSGFSIGSVVSGFSAFDPQFNCPGLDDIMDWLCNSGLIPPTPCVGAGPAPGPAPVTCPLGPPLAPHLKDPRIPGNTAKCRGVCGIDCARSCKDIDDIIIYVPTTAGDHYICTYPNPIECGSHQGCRDHDACYDCCVASGYPSIGDICHLACDCACQQTYAAGTCIGWALGFGPFDSTMVFSDPPYAVGPLPGPPPGGSTNVTPALPAGDCCSAALAAGLDNGDFGGVICCNDVKHACVWAGNIPAANPTARGIIAGCVGEHEAVHLNHVDCTGAALERPPFKPGVSPAAGECAAYLVEIACYERRLAECGSDADCCREVRAELAFARGQAAANCGSAPAGSMPPCPAAAGRSNRIRLQLQHKSDDVVPAEVVEENRSITAAEGKAAVDRLLNKPSRSVKKACKKAGDKMKKTIDGYPPQGVDAIGNVARKFCDDHPDFERTIRLDLENLAGKNFTS